MQHRLLLEHQPLLGLILGLLRLSPWFLRVLRSWRFDVDLDVAQNPGI